MPIINNCPIFSPLQISLFLCHISFITLPYLADCMVLRFYALLLCFPCYLTIEISQLSLTLSSYDILCAGLKKRLQITITIQEQGYFILPWLGLSVTFWSCSTKMSKVWDWAFTLFGISVLLWRTIENW